MKYYAVERSNDSLCHYGVKGMKWGVRKKVDTGVGQRPRSPGYKKALKKLSKLENHDNHAIKKGPKSTPEKSK